MNKPVNIAVVDDDEFALTVFRLNFKAEVKAGKIVMHFFNSARKFLEFLDQNQSTVNITLVFSDINMPEMEGFDLLIRLHEKYPEIKVYMETAYARSDYERKAEDLGAKGFFYKPIDFSAVKKTVENFIANQVSME